MVQAGLADRLLVDLLAFSQDGFVPAKSDVGGGDIGQTLVAARVVLVIDNGPDLAFEVAGRIAVFQQNPVFQRPVPSFRCLAVDTQYP